MRAKRRLWWLTKSDQGDVMTPRKPKRPKPHPDADNDNLSDDEASELHFQHKDWKATLIPRGFSGKMLIVALTTVALFATFCLGSAVLIRAIAELIKTGVFG